MSERIYLDTAPVIYAIERVAFYAPLVDRRLATSDIILVASDLTRLECRVLPLRKGDADLLSDYDQFFEEVVNRVVTLLREVIDRATEIRTRYGFKTPDAIHLAAAVISESDVFLTNDYRLERFTDLSIETVEPTDTSE